MEKIFIEAFKNTIGSDYLFICDDELFARELYTKNVTEKQGAIAENFRASVNESIESAINNGDIKLVEYSYEAISESGEVFIKDLNNKIALMTEKQAEIVSDIRVDLELDTELNISDINNFKTILEIVIAKENKNSDECINTLLKEIDKICIKKNIQKDMLIINDLIEKNL